MTRIVANEGEQLGEDYSGWPLRQRLELLASDATLGGVPQELVGALWEAIDRLNALPRLAGRPDGNNRVAPLLAGIENRLHIGLTTKTSAQAAQHTSSGA
jgi:hypothetical protein